VNTRLIMTPEGYAKVNTKIDEIQTLATEAIVACSESNGTRRKVMGMRSELFELRNLLQTELDIDPDVA